MEKPQEQQARFGIVNFERRRHPRFSIDLPIEYYRINSPATQQGRTGNISEGGLMVYLPERLEIGQNLRMKLFFPSVPELETIEIMAQLAWVDLPVGESGDYRSGVRFVEIAPEDLNKLRNFVNNLARI